MVRSAYQRAGEEQWAIRSALKLYERACTRSWLHRLWSFLGRRSGRLVDLSEVEADCAICDRCYAGIHTVPLDQICGSSGRCHDFDSAFYPLRGHNKGRWLNVAVARQMGTTLPPVELIRVEDRYFVQDGHHRISVARMLGQDCIEAEVVVWQVASPLPWAAHASDRRRTLVRVQQTAEAFRPG
jgi:hypothetical protein